MEHYINFYNPLESPLSDPILYTIASHFFTPSELRGNKKFIQGRYVCFFYNYVPYTTFSRFIQQYVGSMQLGVMGRD